MTDILLIRHGETAWNAVRRLQGHLDIPLNEEGLRQARALGAALKNEKLDAVISSDLQRARQTAAAITVHQNLPLHTDAGLRERCYGDFEGELYSEIQQKYPQAYAEWKSNDPDVRFPQGKHTAETLREFHQRVISHIVRYAQQFKGGKIALVAHGGVLECAYREAHALPLQTPRAVTIYNASINRFALRDDRLQMLSWGDISHLDAPDVLDEIALPGHSSVRTTETGQ